MDLSALTPPGAVLVPLIDSGQDVPLYPREAELVADAAARRRRDFALGRACARAALARLGHGDAVVGRGTGGAPLWPAGIVGAITHTHGFAAALAAPAARYRAVGIDAERSGGMNGKLFARLFTPSEQAGLAGLPEDRRLAAATLLFSAKEAYYKAAHPLTGWRLNFRQLAVSPGDGVFSLCRTDDGGGAHAPVTGRFVMEDDLVVTALWW